MYSLYPIAFLAGYLIWATINYLDEERESQAVEIPKIPEAGPSTGGLPNGVSPTEPSQRIFLPIV